MTSVTSSDGSLGEQESTSSADSRRPRRSLDDELLSLQRARDADFSDMPSLSSLRTEEMNAVTSTSDTPNSKGGNPKAGDCDASLPSLSSIRIDELSACSSLPTNNHHLSDQSVEGCCSITSGNVSGETDSEDGRRRPKSNDHSSAPPIRPSRSSSGSSLTNSIIHGSPMQGKSLALLSKAAKKPMEQDISIPKNATTLRRSSSQGTSSRDNISFPMVRPTRTTSPVLSEPHNGVNSNAYTEISHTKGSPRLPARNHSPDGESPGRASVERTKSLDFSLLQSPQKDKNGSATEESSSSLHGGDSLPRIPRRTGTGNDESFPTATRRFSDDASNLSDVSTKMSDDDVTHISDGNVSLESDVESDISIDTDTEHISLGDDLSERSSVGSANEPVARKHTVQYPSEQAMYRDDKKKAIDSAESIDSRKEESKQQINASDDITRLEASIEMSPALGAKLEKRSSDLSSERKANKNITKNEPSNTDRTTSGTSSTDAEGLDRTIGSKQSNDGENKRGSLLRKVSNSFRSIGKSASFRNSFRAIGKQASKLKMKAIVKRQKEEGNDSSPH